MFQGRPKGFWPPLKNFPFNPFTKYHKTLSNCCSHISRI